MMNVTVTLNAARNGIELRFPSRPAREVIDRIRTFGFRWSRRQKIWYAKQSDSRIQFARTLEKESIAEGEASPSPYRRRSSYRRRSLAFYFPSTGATVYQNGNGRCEDAPCCGCCS